jgi:hypothetical protein
MMPAIDNSIEQSAAVVDDLAGREVVGNAGDFREELLADILTRTQLIGGRCGVVRSTKSSVSI